MFVVSVDNPIVEKAIPTDGVKVISVNTRRRLDGLPANPSIVDISIFGCFLHIMRDPSYITSTIVPILDEYSIDGTIKVQSRFK